MSQFDGTKKLGLIVCLMLGGGALFSSPSVAKKSSAVETQAAGTLNPDGSVVGAPAAPAPVVIPPASLEGRWAGTFHYNKNRADADVLNEVDAPALMHLVHESEGVFTGYVMATPKRPPMGAAKVSMRPDGTGGYILQSERMGNLNWNLFVRLNASSADEMSGTWTNENYRDDLPAKGRITFKRVVLKEKFAAKLSGALKGNYTYFSGESVTKHNLTISIRDEVSEDTYQGTITGENYAKGPFGGIYEPKTGVFEIKTDRTQPLTLFRIDNGWTGILDVGNEDGGPITLAP